MHLDRIGGAEENQEFKFTFDTHSKQNANDISHHINNFISEIDCLNINDSAKNSVFKATTDLISGMSQFFASSLNENSCDTPSFILEQCSDFVCNQIAKNKSSYLRNKRFQTNEFYVAPKECAVGLRWEMKKVKRNGKFRKIPRLIQCTFQFVSIVETLTSLFKCKEFQEMYIDYNMNSKHKCKSDIYCGFCCASACKQNIFYKQNPLALKIQIYIDDFEICNPLASKSGIHKTCAVYFSILNVPVEFASKLKNIYLVILGNANDIKTKYTDINNFWRPIVDDLKYLERQGIRLSCGKVIKGSLARLSCDNLGANVSLGFAGSFAASHYCRICTMEKEDCQTQTKIDPASMRTKENYEEHIETVKESTKVDFAETMGIKHYCILNDLNYFHIIDNPTLDNMHDLDEGTIPHLLKLLFESCISLNLFKLDELNYLIQFHDYGSLNRRNVPSEINLDKRSLGQNATQSLCLFRNISFLLYKYKDHPDLADAWKCVISLQQIITILYSHEISHCETETLDEIATQHLSEMSKCFELPFIVKEHNLLHYGHLIRSVGPSNQASTKRYESKHQIFKGLVNNTKNFRNIHKTLALKHQKKMCAEGFGYENDIETSKPKKFDSNHYRNQFSVLQNVSEVNYLRFNNYDYEKDLLFDFNSKFYQIQHILCDSSKYYLLAKEFNILNFDKFLNSFSVEVSSPDNFILVNLNDLKQKQTFEIKKLFNREYIYVETLEVKRMYRVEK